MGGQTATRLFCSRGYLLNSNLTGVSWKNPRPCAACIFCCPPKHESNSKYAMFEAPKYVQHLTRLSLSTYTQISARAKIQLVRSSSALSKPNRFCCCDIIMQEQTNITRCCNRRATHEPEGIDSCCRIRGLRCMCL